MNSLDVNTGFAYTDMFIGASLGWHLKRADITAGYNLYIPTGRFSQGGTNNTGLGISKLVDATPRPSARGAG